MISALLVAPRLSQLTRAQTTRLAFSHPLPLLPALRGMTSNCFPPPDWLAGAYFVHLGPREYPGSASSRGGAGPTSSVERSAVAGGQDEDGGGTATTSTPQAPPRRTMGGSSTREAFRFEGFPDVPGKDTVAPDF